MPTEKAVHKRVVIAALSPRATNWNRPEHLLAGEWIHGLVYPCKGSVLSNKKERASNI